MLLTSQHQRPTSRIRPQKRPARPGVFHLRHTAMLQSGDKVTGAVAGQIKLQRHWPLEREWPLHLLILPPLQNLAVRQVGHVIRHPGAGDEVGAAHANQIMPGAPGYVGTPGHKHQQAQRGPIHHRAWPAPRSRPGSPASA